MAICHIHFPDTCISSKAPHFIYKNTFGLDLLEEHGGALLRSTTGKIQIKNTWIERWSISTIKHNEVSPSLNIYNISITYPKKKLQSLIQWKRERQN